MFVKQNTVMISSKKIMHSSFFVVDLIVELRLKSFEKCEEIASKTTKTSIFLTSQVNLRHFSFTN